MFKINHILLNSVGIINVNKQNKLTILFLLTGNLQVVTIKILGGIDQLLTDIKLFLSKP